MTLKEPRIFLPCDIAELFRMLSSDRSDQSLGDLLLNFRKSIDPARPLHTVRHEGVARLQNYFQHYDKPYIARQAVGVLLRHISHRDPQAYYRIPNVFINAMDAHDSVAFRLGREIHFPSGTAKILGEICARVVRECPEKIDEVFRFMSAHHPFLQRHYNVLPYHDVQHHDPAWLYYCHKQGAKPDNKVCEFSLSLALRSFKDSSPLIQQEIADYYQAVLSHKEAKHNVRHRRLALTLLSVAGQDLIRSHGHQFIDLLKDVINDDHRTLRCYGYRLFESVARAHPAYAARIERILFNQYSNEADPEAQQSLLYGLEAARRASSQHENKWLNGVAYGLYAAGLPIRPIRGR